MSREHIVAILPVIVIENFSIDVAHLRGHGGHGFDHQAGLLVVELSHGLAFFGREHHLVAVMTLDRFRARCFGLRVQLLPMQWSVERSIPERVVPFRALLDAGALQRRIFPSHFAVTAAGEFADAGQFGKAEVFVGRGLINRERAFQALLGEIDGGVLDQGVARFIRSLSAGGGDEVVVDRLDTRKRFAGRGPRQTGKRERSRQQSQRQFVDALVLIHAHTSG